MKKHEIARKLRGDVRVSIPLRREGESKEAMTARHKEIAARNKAFAFGRQVDVKPYKMTDFDKKKAARVAAYKAGKPTNIFGEKK